MAVKKSTLPTANYQFNVTPTQARKIAKAQMLSDGAPEAYADNVLSGDGATSRTAIYQQVRRHLEQLGGQE